MRSPFLQIYLQSSKQLVYDFNLTSLVIEIQGKK